MFDIFKSDTESRPQDVKGLREAVLRFIKDELQRVEGGEGSHIKGLHIFLMCSEEQTHVYESAVYAEEPQKFREEIQKIADDFAISLPENWMIETTFTDALPTEAIKSKEIDAALFIKTTKHALQKSGDAYIRVLSGEAEKTEYHITSDSGKIRIGREKKAQDSNGFFRMNTIAFPGDSQNECNKYISRQHAHIEWNNDAGVFILYADEGGVPPHNKIKIQSSIDEEQIKLNSTEIGHTLQEGDQIILGESAVLEFSFRSEEE
ncbi:MAG: hypothetical protein K0S09_76 [Sphingobacteriaceae bacterium]|jgi:pSer/pThr/pTyr-binding forkhead associated (FHA) protein|nr:hypothetical protein [Sphingobacteriaceae bacterium]